MKWQLLKMSNFTMVTILGKGFAQAQMHTNHSMSAEGTSAVMYARALGGHSTTTWTEFCRFLTPPPPAWTVFTP